MARVDKTSIPSEEEVILLTEVVEEPPTEPVLELTEGEDDFRSRLHEMPKAAETAPVGAETDDSLADLLSALKELPPDFATPGEILAAQEPVPATPAPALPEAEVAAIVREVAAEIIERLAREVVPQVAERLVAAEIRALKEKLCR